MGNSQYKKLENEEEKENINPKLRANILSKITFWWMNHIFYIGNKRPLEESDLYPLIEDDKAEYLTERLEKAWSKELEKIPMGKKPRFWKALMRVCPVSEYFYIIALVLTDMANRMTLPVLLGFLISYLMGIRDLGASFRYVLPTGICLTSLGRNLAQHHYQNRSALLGMRFRAAATGILYNKVLRMSQSKLAKISSGHVINLVSNDIQRLDLATQNLFASLRSPFDLVVLGVLLWVLIGWQAVTGLAFALILIPYEAEMTGWVAKLRMQAARVTDRRLEVMNEVISGIRAVKMYAWEWPYRDVVRQIRRTEVLIMRKIYGILSSFASLQHTYDSVICLIAFITLVFTGTRLTPYNIFTMVGLLSENRRSLVYGLTDGMQLIADCFASLDRIEHFLLIEELSETGGSSRKASCQEEREEENEEEKEGEPYIRVNNVACHWNGTDVSPVLSDINMDFNENKLVLVTGPVGSGKSSLLLTLLGELLPSEGSVKTRGEVVYVPQTAWVFSGTVRENILFSKPYDEERYQRTLEACDLAKDIVSLPQGDATILGERGASLSGGQKARVNLARAVYADGDIYLLDDPLSAVDAKVGKHIFENCITGVLENKIRILVTHQLQHLKNADYIMIMDRGAISHEGDYQQVQDSGLDLESLEEEFRQGWEKYHQLHDKEQPLSKEKQAVKKATKKDTSDSEPIQGMARKAEERHVGTISAKLYWRYFRSGLHACLLILLVLLFLIAQASIISPNLWLVHMSRMKWVEQKHKLNLIIYGCLVGGALFLAIIRGLLYYITTLRCSENLHDKMVVSILKTPVHFYDTNPSGRILNRFSKDIGIVDEFLPPTSLLALQYILQTLASVCVTCSTNYWAIFGVVPMLLGFIGINRYYLKTSREIKRMEAISQSPVLAHLADTLEGIVLIRTYHMENRFIQRFNEVQDHRSQIWFLVPHTARWMGIRLDFVCTAFVAIATFTGVSSTSDAGTLGLSLVYAISTVGQLQFAMRQTADVENMMTSVERVMSYTHLDEEPGYYIEKKAPESWPAHGNVKFENVSLRYYEGGPQVLHNLNIDIKGGERVGVAGRTGAGKSSLVAALFRMPDPEGKIIIDDQEIGQLNIQNTRRVISVITQNPTLFSGSLRINLDPFSRYDDAALWNVLEQVEMKDKVKELPGELYFELSESGNNFGVGERQLLCLARALLNKNKIIVMDEATANVDFNTDRSIQETIRSKFSGCTVITIAHRLNTILDYDKVLVMEKGQAMEFDSPDELLKRGDGMLTELFRNQSAALS
ncbi:ATP-binding cassette sub-family C member 4 [Nematostella vectensis]|uniref:ATP-binding cassette sub-family C member 4 n=1 Tax=Nematostella vectensis TaxID=45351 RepID=UPI0013904EC1|nr:ATP-binding cassette sub-family C member 4 [Nematostella vectensis]XP_032234170.1 ATP-binding cassette sub-family C member 4 [Nematostella vectensis]XP_048580721.1 ATP-binding cassette sub-family C member 4 [Nematostella vectensis]